jgi:hypothetical protein
MPTTVCIPLEAKPKSCCRLTALVEGLRLGEEQGSARYRRSMQQSRSGPRPSLHAHVGEVGLAARSRKEYFPPVLLRA